jgi:glycogen synthase
MKICYVFNDYPINDNLLDTGVGKYIHDLSQELSKKHSVYIICQSNRTEIIKQNHVTIYSIKRIKLPILNRVIILWCIYNLRIVWNLLRLNSMNHFDIIEFGNWEVSGIVIAIICLLTRSQIKIICRLHTGTFDIDAYENRISPTTYIIHFVEQIFVNFPNVKLSTSTRVHARHCRSVYRISNKEIFIIPLGIKIKKQIPSKYIKLKTDCFRILFIGKLEYRKGIYTLIRAARYIFQKIPNSKLFIIGQTEIDIFNLIQRYIPFKYSENIHYLGYLDSDYKKEFYINLADTIVLPSLYESFGLSIIEAMSYGKAVITCYAGGIPEIITNNVNGLIVPINDYRKLANNVYALYKDSNLRSKLGLSARKMVVDKFSVTRMSNNNENFYVNV